MRLKRTFLLLVAALVLCLAAPAVAAAAPTITGGPNGPTNDKTPNFTFNDDSFLASPTCSIDDSTPNGACTSTSTYTSPNLNDGAHTFYVEGHGLLGSTGVSSRSFTVDTVPPNTAIVNKPATLTNSSSASFTYTSTESPSTFECKLDGGNFTSCPIAGQAYTNLSPGSHTFQVRASDQVANTDQSPDSYTWTVDTAAPDTSIVNKPSNPSNSAVANFTYTSTESPSTFECKLDGSAFTSCPSGGQGYTNLAEGSHTFQVRAIDQAGNPDATPAAFTWTVDTAAPDTTIVNKPSNPTGSTSASFTYTSTEANSTFECRLDGTGGFTSCPAAGKDYTGLAAGPHSFEVRAIDQAGNTDQSPALYVWVIQGADTTPPDTNIVNKPPNPSTSTSASFTYTATEAGSTFECQIDGGGFASCPTAGKDYTGLGQGSHTFQVRAKDSAGNTDQSPDSYTWVIDSQAPDTNIVNKPPNPSTSTSASFTYSATEAGSTFECQIDGGGFASCPTAGKDYTGLGQGSHTFQVRARDPLGNTDPTPASYTWSVDSQAPDTTIGGKPANPSTSTSANFTFFSNEGGVNNFECKLDSGSFTSCPNGTQGYTGLSQGSHTFQVRAIDAAGNVDGTPASYTWVIDSQAPDTNIVNKPLNPTTSTSASFTYTATEANSTFECQIDGGGFASCPVAGKNYPSLGQGSHTFQVRATDPLNNTDPTPASYTWTIQMVGDTTPPDTNIVNKPTDPTTDTTADFTYTATEAGSTFECKLDGASFTSCPATGQSYTSLAVGVHTFKVQATDQANNLDQSPAEYTWTIQAVGPSDTTPPETTIDSAPASLTKAKRPSFTFSANEPSTFFCRFDNQQYDDCTSPFTPGQDLPDGIHTFDVYAVDAAVNPDPSPSRVTFKIDSTAPTARITKRPKKKSGHKKQKTSASRFEFTADESGVAYECRIDTAAFTTCASPYTVKGVPNGKHKFQVRATDAIGNVGAPVTARFTFRKKRGGTSGPPVPTPPDIDPCALQPTITGTEGNDVITGSPGGDVINALGGDDKIVGGGGDDLICGGLGSDNVSGGPGNDIVSALAGNDALNGGEGNDVLLGGEGNDHVDGIDGNDLLYGGTGLDYLTGGAGADFLDGGLGNDQCDGGADKDAGVGCERATPFKVAPS